jgi:hypothetical protein
MIYATRGTTGALSATGGTRTTLRTGSAYDSASNNIFYSVMNLTDGDIRVPPTITQGTGSTVKTIVYVVRYATGMASRTVSTPPAGVYTDLTLTGFTPRPGSLVLCWSEDPDWGRPDTLPSPWVSYRHTSGGSTGIADTFLYRGGNVVLTDTDGSTSGLGGGLIEVY